MGLAGDKTKDQTILLFLWLLSIALCYETSGRVSVVMEVSDGRDCRG